MSYFWGKATGLTADIQRHRAAEVDLLARIAALSDKPDNMSIAALCAYTQILFDLQQSKADTVDKIGKK